MFPPPDQATLPMSAVLAFMERWRPGSTHDVRGATPEQIARLADPLAAVSALPSVYLDFLQTMGESTGSIRLVSGTTAASALLADREDSEWLHLDQTRYFKYGLADLHEVIPLDAFLDLTRRSQDGRDAPVVRGLEDSLARGSYAPMQGRSSFSDQIRNVVFAQVALASEPSDLFRRHLYLEKDPAAPARTVRFLQEADLGLTELGASSDTIPLESTARGIALLLTAGSHNSGLVDFKTKTEAEAKWLYELLQDHMAELSGQIPESQR